MRASRFDRITALARERVISGTAPDVAWLETLKEVYPGDRFPSQAQHTCPKGAFCILCHEGKIRGIPAGSCPSAEGLRSAEFTLAALEVLRADPSLAENKRELKRRVFGEPGTPNYRKPNDEVEVLLAFWNAGLLKRE